MSVSLHMILAIALLAPLQAAEADELDLDAHRGEIIYLDFWASWCVPCLDSFPWMNEMQSRYGSEGLTIIAVNVDENPADAAEFLARMPAEFEVIYDPQGELAATWDVPGMPTTFIIGTDGELISSHIGFRTSDRVAYESEIRALLDLTAMEIDDEG